MKNRYTTLFLFLIGVLSLDAQDIHFTQFDLSPLQVNPAMAGSSLGSYRLGAISRVQDSMVPGQSGFTSYGFNADAGIIKGFRKKDWVGIGLEYFSDNASFATKRASHITISYNAGFGMNDETNSSLSLGIRYGRISQNFNEGALADLMDGFQNGELLGNIDIQDLQDYQVASIGGTRSYRSFSDWNLGLKYKLSPNKKSNIEVGGAFYHIQTKENFVTDTISMKTRRIEPLVRPRFTTFLSYETEITKKISMNPRLLISNTEGNIEILPQAVASFLLNEEKALKLDAGLGGRIGDTVDSQVILGMRIKDFRIGLASDFYVENQSPRTNGLRGLELGISYNGRVHKKPKSDTTSI